MIRIVPTKAEYADDIYEIEQASFSMPWSKRAIEEEILNKHAVCLTALDENGTVIGHANMRHIINEGHINNIIVAEHHRRKGAASMLVAELIKAAVQKEMIGLTLEVRQSNCAAIRLYEKHGFAAEGVRKSYYSKPTEDAIIMWKHIEVHI